MSSAGKPITFAGVRVRVDRPVGYVQEGRGKDGKPWKRVYKNDYGYIPGTQGGDGEGLDVFLGPDPESKEAFMAVQKKGDKSFDEFKLFLGFPDKAAATRCYTDHIPKRFLDAMFSIPLGIIQGLTGKPPEVKLASGEDDDNPLAKLMDIPGIAAMLKRQGVAPGALAPSSKALDFLEAYKQSNPEPDAWDQTEAYHAWQKARSEAARKQIMEYAQDHPLMGPEQMKALEAKLQDPNGDDPAYAVDRYKKWYAQPERFAEPAPNTLLHAQQSAEKAIAEKKGLRPAQQAAYNRLVTPNPVERDSGLDAWSAGQAVGNPRSIGGLRHLTDEEQSALTQGLPLSELEQKYRNNTKSPLDVHGVRRGELTYPDGITPRFIHRDAARPSEAADAIELLKKPDLLSAIEERMGGLSKEYTPAQIEAAKKEFAEKRKTALHGMAMRAGANVYLPNFAKNLLGTPEELTAAHGAEKATGLKRLGQLIHGTRLTALRDQLESMDLRDPRRVPLLQELGAESEPVYKGQNALTAASLAMPTIAKYTPVALAGAIGGKAALRRKMLDSMGSPLLSKEERALPEEDRDKLIMERSSMARMLFGESKETPDFTAADARNLAVGGAVIGHGLQATAPETLEKLVGARRFWHGTTMDAAKSILGDGTNPGTGIDPGLGGRVGGAAWRNTQKQHLTDTMAALANVVIPENMKAQVQALLEQKAMDSGLDPALIKTDTHWGLASGAKSTQPGVNVPGLKALGAARLGGGALDILSAGIGDGKDGLIDLEKMPGGPVAEFIKATQATAAGRPDVDVDASGFVERAKRTPFIATAPGAAQQYALMQNPEMAAGRVQRAQQHLSKGQLIKAIKAFVTGMPQEGASPVIGGAMPENVFRRDWTRDPDDTEQAGKAFKLNEAARSKVPEYEPGFWPTKAAPHAIQPEQLAANDVSLKQIIQNRAQNMGEYIRGTNVPDDERLLGLNKRFLSGVGRLGGTALGTAAVYHGSGAHNAVKKLVRKGKEKYEEYKNQSPAAAVEAPAPPAAPPPLEDKQAADLTAASRDKIKDKNFALPDRRYPIHDLSHARAALSMVARHGTPEEKSKVHAAVAAKWPALAARSVSLAKDPG